jgi:hypothetical protein
MAPPSDLLVDSKLGATAVMRRTLDMVCLTLCSTTRGGSNPPPACRPEKNRTLCADAAKRMCTRRMRDSLVLALNLVRMRFPTIWTQCSDES